MNDRDAYRTLLSTVQELSAEGPTGLWRSLLRAAVGVVEGAEGGSVLVRDGAVFRPLASIGFERVPLEVSQEAAVAWYGDPDGWARGEPRVVAGPEYRGRLEEALALAAPDLRDEGLGRVVRGLLEVRANLCLPIGLGGRVEAYVNLDSRSREDAFGEASVEAARLLVLQVTTLLAARQDRLDLEARVHEFQVIERLTAALQSALTADQIAARLASEVGHLMDSPHVDILTLHQSGDYLEAQASLGLFARFRHSTVPKGAGLSWASLESGRLMLIPDVLADPRNFNPLGEASPPHAQLTTPLLDSHGQPLGVIHAARDLPHGFSEPEVRTMEVIGRVAAGAFERVSALARLERQLRETQTLLRTVEALALGSYERVWDDLLGAAVELVPGSQAGSLWIEEGAEFRMVAQQGYDDRLLGTRIGREMMEYWFGPEERWRAGEPRLGRREFLELAARAQAAHLSAEQIERFEGAGQFREIMCTLCLPIVSGGELLAYINLDNLADEYALGEGSVEAARGFAIQVAALVGAHRHHAEREAAHEGALRAIGIALEARDRETAGHTDRVAEMAERIGLELGLGPAELRDLRWGAYLHDIGKLAIPDSVLLKPGPLDEAEWEAMRKHSELGYRFTQNLPFLPEASRRVVLEHHERWAGGGYPGGRSGPEVSLLTRIFSVCDVFDALISPRPYKPAWPVPEAVSEIARQRGRHFDPQVVGAFLRVVGGGPPSAKL